MNALSLRQIADTMHISFDALRKRALREHWQWSSETVINHKSTRLFDPAALPEDIRLRLTPESNTLPAVAAPRPVIAVPDKGRKIALARFDLLRLWKEWRTAYKGNAGQADAEFIRGYEHSLCPQLRQVLGPVSIKSLYRWQATLGDAQDYTALIPNYYGRGKGGEPTLSQAERDLFMGLLLQPNKPKIGTAVSNVAFALKKHGLAIEHSPATFRRYAEQFRARNNNIWTLMRDGAKALRDTVEPYIRRDPSKLEVGDVLVSDGHRLNFQVINPFTGKPCRATLIGYLDWKSYHLAGAYIMIEETTQSIAAAMRAAIINLGKTPKVAYQDNGQAFRSRFFTAGSPGFEESGIDGLFARLGIIACFAHPYNARAKVIEGWWNKFTETFERLVPSYTGASIADKPAWTKRNEKWHKALHNEYIPTIDEALEMLAQWQEFAGSLECPHVAGKTCKQVFDEGRGPGVDPATLDDLMMTERVGYIGNHGIRFLGTDYWSDELYGLKQRAIVRYSILDRSSIKVYTTREEFICTAKRVTALHPMAILGTEQDRLEVGNAIAHQRELEQKTMRAAQRLLAPEALPFKVPAVPQPQLSMEQKTPQAALPKSLHIPENATTPKAQLEKLETTGTRPLFAEAYQRYEWHQQNGCQTEEDRQWVEEFRKSDLYRLVYAFHEA